MPYDYRSDAHRTTSLLQIQISVAVLVGCSERTDGERLHVTQRSRNFVWQREAEKVDVFVGTCVLKRQNRDCRLGRGTAGRGGEMRNPPEEKSGKNCHNNAAY